jgi:2-polyprenyl-3-methyl-5-hydroxy-6-metoxy-1,4-benzoquinol methylase
MAMRFNQISASDSTYVLGHVDAEIRRLLLQGRLHDDFTEYALRLAGLRPGMRVLDVGCGPGDVSFVAARLVGPTGTVLGVDAAADVVGLARTRAANRHLATVRFEPIAIENLSLDEPVDAVIGRLILMHLPDPAAALRHLAAMVRPDGLVALCESDITGVYSVPDLPLLLTIKDALVNIFQSAGLDPAFGAKLHLLFRRAGLPAPQLRLGAPVGSSEDTDLLAYVVQTWRSMLPTAKRLGLIPDELTDLDTLERRLQAEAAEAQALIVMPPMICAWTQV